MHRSAPLTIDDEGEIRDILRSASTIALVGASQKPWRDSNSIMTYLLNAGYDVIPVNPNYQTVLGRRCFPDLRSIPSPIDIVDIFRRAESVLPIVHEAIETGAKVIWMQTGIINDEAAGAASRAGLKVLMDRCIAVDHRRLCREG